MSEYDFIDIDICADCLMWHANGDLSGVAEDDILAVVTASGIDAGYDVEPGGSGSDDGHFSKQPCDSCRQPLGGMRWPATMMIALPVPADRIGE
jgi:hypothetical protein